MIDVNIEIETCIEILNNGGLILYPTDTIWGIGCDATNAVAVAKIYQLKKRQEEKSLIILLAEEKEINSYLIDVDPEVFKFLKTVTKPTTIIYDGAVGLAENTINKDGSIAIRITKDPFCKQLIKKFRKPIISTSANLAGTPSPAMFAAIDPIIKNGVDYIVEFRQDDETIALPSSIIKWNKNGTHIIIR